MEELKLEVKILSIEELERANKEFQPKFNSAHEAYSILKEEIEEAAEELKFINGNLDHLWICTKRNIHESAIEHAKDMKENAINLSAEAIQVAAMAQKFIDSFEK